MKWSPPFAYFWHLPRMFTLRRKNQEWCNLYYWPLLPSSAKPQLQLGWVGFIFAFSNHPATQPPGHPATHPGKFISQVIFYLEWVPSEPQMIQQPNTILTLILSVGAVRGRGIIYLPPWVNLNFWLKKFWAKKILEQNTISSQKKFWPNFFFAKLSQAPA